MGFIASGNTLELTAYLTQRGRDLLLNGSEEDIVGKYFALGDSDSNYTVELRNGEGFVPDLTGDDTDCILSLANNVGIKHPIPYKDDVPEQYQEVRLKRPDNGRYYDVLNCLINLDCMGRYALYNSADNVLNPDASKLDIVLKSIFPQLYSQIDTLTVSSETPTVEEISDITEYEFDLMFDQTVYKSLVNTYLDNSNTVNQNSSGVSPIQLTFSSRNTYKGAGEGGVGVMGREIGYAYRAFDQSTWSFYNPTVVENQMDYTFFTDENNQIIEKFTDFTLAARVYAKNLHTNLPDTFIYRGDTNLQNMAGTTFDALPTNELKQNNHFLKLFKRSTSNIIGNNIISNNNVVDDQMGVVQHEYYNLRDFVFTSPLFQQISGTNEYRTSKLTFNIYQKGNRNIKPAILNIIFKFNEDILLDGDSDYAHISSCGCECLHVQYDFEPTNGVFWNRAKSGTFVKTCGSGIGSSVPYTVAKGSYSGTTQAIADGLAQADVDTNGQAYAQTHGTCPEVPIIYYSAPYDSYVTKNNCTEGTGSSVHVVIPYGAYTSYVSQFDADIQAITAAQAYANANGTCNVDPVVFYSAPFEGYVVKNDCGPSYT